MQSILNLYKKDYVKYLLIFTASVSVITGLFFLSNFNFLLFHIFVEISIIISIIFISIISWYGRKFLSTDFLLILGISKIFVALVEFLHVVSYKGMNIIYGYDANLPTSLWILARYLDALTFVMIFAFTKKKIKLLHIMIGYSIVTGTMIFLIFARIFPTCYIEGEGLTLFKIISEYIISFLFIVTCFLIYKFRLFTPKIRRLIIFSLIFNTIGEIFFTFYVSVYGISNVFGHLSLFVSMGFLFVVFVKEGIQNPYNLIFKELIEKNEKIKLMNRTHKIIYSLIKHDLRNRLSAAIGFFEIYNEEKIDPYFQKGMENLELALVEMENISSILTEELTDIVYVLDIGKELDDIIKKFNVKIVKEGDCKARANKTLISVIYNIILNGVTHGSATLVRLKILSRNKTCIIRISNNGLKIKEEIVNSLFVETIQKGDRTSMGLFISNKLISLLGGKITLVSNEEGNVTFEIEVPKCPNNKK
ncbi:MAG: hypothetical protein K9W45_02795 [Candidatus Heimdallarchaeum aukensis]|uniref:histidine kinase n=1 Tax=Candidatus Heimdallarchaeum aukensis TaxID=2876573 RepID=A0A9Y1FM14_9ARCH|nr:MAG: hypothetical protein K9W45_02795 [Candidatus Heimdallarchaeum aukensis]